MIQRIIIPVLLMVVFSGIVFYVVKVSKEDDVGGTQSASTPAISTRDNVITITASGPSPKNITIQKGDTVIFVNADTEEHWPASDPHPSHTIYPQFDPKHDITPGESWQFTFTRVGTWGFHDHENPLHRGTVTVLAKNTTTDTKAPRSIATDADCLKTSTDFSCYENYYDNLVATKGVEAAFADLKQRYIGNSYVQSQCHPLTHVIGHGAVELYPKVSEAYTHGDSFCWSGFYHGVMEGIIAKIGKKAVVSQLDNICSDIPGKDRYSFDYYNCVHGLGHGLMALTSDELFDSLTTCDNLTGAWEKSSCYGGVFMENVIVDNKNHFTKYLKPAEPLYPCNAVGASYKTSCYLMQTSYMLKVTGSDFKKVFDLCATADLGFEATCYQSLGRDASGQSVSNAEKTKATCDLGANYEQKSNCIVGAVKDFISYYHSDTQALHLCNILSSDLTQICTDTAHSYYTSL